MDETLMHLLAGLAGGLIRALVGITKAQAEFKKDFVFDWKRLGLSLFVAGIVGIASGLLVQGTLGMAFLAGYAGPDFLENLYKIKFNVPSATS